jgi:hypothetical protein
LKGEEDLEDEEKTGRRSTGQKKISVNQRKSAADFASPFASFAFIRGQLLL